MSNRLTFDETCKMLNKTPEEILELIKIGKLHAYVPINGKLRRYRIDGWKEDGSLIGAFLND